MRGEKFIDPRLKALFEGKLKDIPVDSLNPGGKNPIFAKPQAKKLARSTEGIDADMERLKELEGEAYWKQLKEITERREFKKVEKNIFSAA